MVTAKMLIVLVLVYGYFLCSSQSYPYETKVFSVSTYCMNLGQMIFINMSKSGDNIHNDVLNVWSDELTLIWQISGSSHDQIMISFNICRFSTLRFLSETVSLLQSLLGPSPSIEIMTSHFYNIKNTALRKPRPQVVIVQSDP